MRDKSSFWTRLDSMEVVMKTILSSGSLSVHKLIVNYQLRVTSTIRSLKHGALLMTLSRSSTQRQQPFKDLAGAGCAIIPQLGFYLSRQLWTRICWWTSTLNIVHCLVSTSGNTPTTLIIETRDLSTWTTFGRLQIGKSLSRDFRPLWSNRGQNSHENKS